MLRLVPPRTAAVAVALVVAGIVLAALVDDLAGFVVGGLGVILVVALAFYAVGRSEDLERERQRERKL